MMSSMASYYIITTQDDFRVCTHYGVIKKGELVVCPVDETGCFTSEVTDFKGQYVKVKTVCVFNTVVGFYKIHFIFF